MRRYSVYCVVLWSLVLLVGCGSGGSSSSGNAPGGSVPPPATPPSDSFTLSGTAVGLSGPLIINNGFEELTVNDNGEFSFNKPLARGEIYDVRLVSLPDLQLCNLKNSRSFITRNRNDLRIECATMADITLDLSDAILRANPNKRLLSNYQGKGGTGEAPIRGDEESIRAFNNTFVSVLDENSKLIYSTFVDNIERPLFKVNSRSTAIAMVLMEPSIALGILDRDLYPIQVESLVNAIDSLGELDDLSSQIDSIVEQHGYLNLSAANAQQLSTSLNVVLLRTAELIVQMELPELPELDAGVAEQSGIFFSQLTNNTDELEVVVQNRFRRVVSAQSSLFSREYLSPGEEFSFLINKDELVNNSLSVILNGPGNLGSLRQVNSDNFVDASIATSVEEFTLRGVTFLLGVINPGSFNVVECIDSDHINSLLSITKNQFQSTQILFDNQYQIAFRQLAKLARTNALSSNTNLIDELFSCNKFGAGVFIEGTKPYAVLNVTTHLNLLNQLYLVDDNAVDLLSFNKLHTLGESINATYADISWTISNKLIIAASISPSMLAVNELASYSAVCIDPETNANVTCDIRWEFGDGTYETGSSVEHSYNQAGDYLVSAMATGSEGATSIQELPVRVTALAPQMRIRTAQGLSVESGETAIDFSNLRLGEEATSFLIIDNIGSADLLIDSIDLSSNLFSLADSAQAPIAIAEDTSINLNVKFNPSSPVAQSTTVNILSNNPDIPDYSVQITGNGVSQYRAIYSSGETDMITVADARTTALFNPDERTLLVTLYNDPIADYPRLHITLRDYDTATNREGEGNYSLGGENNYCIAYLINSLDLQDEYCTDSTHADSSYGGVANISAGSINYKLLSFNFSAAVINFACRTDCDWVNIDGVVAIEDSDLP